MNKLEHIAFILDGNKRWAKKNNLSNINGYTKGFENIRNLINFSLSINLSHLTIFALSSENFKRTSIKFEPTKPAPPVTKTLFFILIQSQFQ